MQLLRPVLVILSLAVTQAIGAPYPVVTSIKTTITSPKTAYYDVTMEVRDIPGAEQPAPAGWYVAAGHRHDAYPGGRDVSAAFLGEFCTSVERCSTRVVAGESMSSAAMRAFSRIGPVASGRVSHSGYGNGHECVGFFASKNTQPWSTVVFPPGSCVYAPPGRDWCEIVQPSIVLDHGVISLGDANPPPTTSQINVSCTAPMTVRLGMGTDVLELARGVTSRVTVVGADTTGRVSLGAGDNSINLRSDLIFRGTQAGTFSASTVLYIEYL